MKLITKDTDYAVRALKYIYKKNNSVNIAELSKELDISHSFLRKILQMMAHEGILKSVKGKNGGFEIIQSPETIKITDIIEVFQGEIELNRCLVKDEICPDRCKCSLRKKVSEIENFVSGMFSSLSLKDLIDEESQK